MKISDEKIEELLTRGVEEVIVKKDLIKKLKSGRQLRIKHGIDPTTSDLHLGYAVVYQKLKEFQDLGHKVIFLIGDFTARFGDPTAQKKMRGLRGKEEVLELAKNYMAQVGKILDLDKLEIRYNGEWYDKMSAEELLRLVSRFTVARLLERDMFQERIKAHQEIGYHEPIYPILQGYDSVMLKADLTVCGIDQKFNELLGRELQLQFGQPPQDLVLMPLLIGTDGKHKMSQSLGNYIKITESPNEMYGKIMSIPDEIIIHYYQLLTRIDEKEIRKIEKEMKKGILNPRDAKAKLAKEIVTIYHGKEKAELAEKEFERVFRERKIPSKIPEYKISLEEAKINELIYQIGLVSSKSEARRMIEQGAVEIDGSVIREFDKKIKLKDKMIIRVGKRRWAKIRTK